MIKLGYLDGYNAINVPKFASANARDRAFDGYTDYSIDAYYPPYYTNVIKVDITEVPQTSPINFVILVHNSKYYYYFVDKIRYINEEVYEIVINMDTVLTHMFDYIVTNGLITRKSINRWNGTEINRDYVRENVSEGYMEVSSFEYRNPNKYLIVTSSENYIDKARGSGHYKQGGTLYNFGYYVYVFPICPYEVNSVGDIMIYTDSGLTHLMDVHPVNIVNQFIKNAHTINMMLVESDYLDRVLGTRWHEITPYTTSQVIFSIGISTSDMVRLNNQYVCGFNIMELDIDNNRITGKSFGFRKNTQRGVPFDYKFIPQLVDENYIQIEYGDVNGFASYPLHLSKIDNFSLYNNLDITNGNDGYYITEYGETVNKHNTYNISLGLTFDLVSDPWIEYQAQNKGTLSTGLQLQAVNTLYSTVKGIGTNLAGGSSSVSNMTRAYYNVEKNTTSITAKDTSSSGLPRGSLTPISDGLMQGINIMANYQINRDNLMFSPDTVKGRANVYSMMFSKYKSPYLKISTTSDIENCGKKLEEYGYRVNEIIDTRNYMQSLCTNRLYYNCISARVIAYDTLCFIPNDIINDINSRLENGLRFFTFNSDTSGYTISGMLTLDNVELNAL